MRLQVITIYDKLIQDALIFRLKVTNQNMS